MTLRRTRLSDALGALCAAYLIAAPDAHRCDDALSPLAHNRRSKHATTRALRAIARRKRRHE